MSTTESDLKHCQKATIAELGLKARTYNALRRGGYRLVEELLKCSDRDLLKLKNMGKSNLLEIRNALGVSSTGVEVLSFWSMEQQQRQSEAYNLLVAIEQRMRRFIAHYLREHYGTSWWVTGIQESIRCYVDKRTGDIPSHLVNDPLEFVDFGDYKNILTIQSNWNTIFSELIHSKEKVIKHLVRINGLRRSIAHTRPIDTQEFDTLYHEFKFVNNTFRLRRKRRC